MVIPPWSVCSLVNDLALTARRMYADEAKSSGLVRYTSSCTSYTTHPHTFGSNSI